MAEPRDDLPGGASDLGGGAGDAEGPEPSLAAKISGAATVGGGMGADLTSEGAAVGGSAPTTGRVDAASATMGSTTRLSGAAAGEPDSSIGGAMGSSPGEAVADQPVGPEPDERAGFLPGGGHANRPDVSTTGGTMSAEPGGEVRPAVEAADDSGRTGTPKPEHERPKI